MKKVFTATLVLASAMTFAQSAKVVSAYNENRKFLEKKDGSLAKAWEYIEEAKVDPNTSVDPKTWKYRFDILMTIAKAKSVPNAPNEVTGILTDDQIEANLKESYNKVVELDTKKKFIQDLNDQIEQLHNESYNLGVNAYNWSEGIAQFRDTLITTGYIADGKGNAAKVSADLVTLKSWVNKKFPGDANIFQRSLILKCLDASDKAGLASCLDQSIKQSYQASSMGFSNAYEVHAMRGVTDSVSILNAALTAERAGMNKEALEYLKETMRIRYSGSEPYTMAARMYKNEGNKTEQLNIIKAGRVAFPTDQSLIIDELNLYLLEENYAEAEKLLKLATSAQPNNAELYYVLGQTYDNLANPRKDGKDLPKPANFTELAAKAEESYKKALEIKPDLYDALYMYGALLYNQGAELYNKANELDYRTKKAQVDEMNKKADEKFKAAIPVFEKAESIKGDDIAVLQSLKSLYVRMEMTDKFEKVNAKIKSLK